MHHFWALTRILADWTSAAEAEPVGMQVGTLRLRSGQAIKACPSPARARARATTELGGQECPPHTNQNRGQECPRHTITLVGLDRSRSNHLESSAGDAEGDWRLADEFAVRVDVDGVLGLDVDGIGLGVFHLFKSQVTAEINRRKKAEEFEDVHPADDAEIELAVGKIGVRSDLHASAISRSIGDSSQKSRLRRWLSAVHADLHGKRREADEFGRSTEEVATTSAKPLRQAIGTSCDSAIDADTGDRAEVTLGGGGCIADQAEVDGVDLGGVRCELAKGLGGIAHGVESESAGEVVAAAARDDQKRSFEFDQFGEMVVNGSVSAEDDGEVSLLEEGCPFGASEALELGHRFRHVSWADDGSGVHARELEHTGEGRHRGKLKRCERSSALALGGAGSSTVNLLDLAADLHDYFAG